MPKKIGEWSFENILRLFWRPKKRWEQLIKPVHRSLPRRPWVLLCAYCCLLIFPKARSVRPDLTHDRCWIGLWNRETYFSLTAPPSSASCTQGSHQDQNTSDLVPTLACQAVHLQPHWRLGKERSCQRTSTRIQGICWLCLFLPWFPSFSTWQTPGLPLVFMSPKGSSEHKYAYSD